MGLIEHLQACNDGTRVVLDESEWIAVLSMFANTHNLGSQFVGDNLPFKDQSAKELFIQQFYEQVVQNQQAQSNNKLIYFALWTVRLLLREDIALDLVTSNEFVDYIVQKFKDNDDNVRVEAVKCLINTCHQRSSLRSHFAQTGLGSVLSSNFEDLFFNEVMKFNQPFYNM
jgi:hypothetical protein